MLKYAKITNSETNEVSVATGANNWIIAQGYIPQEVEESYNGKWYLKGFAPKAPYFVLRQKEYPTIGEQLDMIYWDKINGTTLWQDKITEIKEKYPKE